jgi:hypothetical protein
MGSGTYISSVVLDMGSKVGFTDILASVSAFRFACIVYSGFMKNLGNGREKYHFQLE